MTKLSQALNPNTSPEILFVLATDEDVDVRYWVAKNPNTSAETLSVLATDEDENVRYWVAKNPNTSPETLAVLATDENELICLLYTSPSPRDATLSRMPSSA